MTNYGKTKVKDLPVLISDKSIFCEGGGRLLSDIIYPIGSIYISTVSTNPSEWFGGVWEQIKDRFLLACGDTYSNGVLGGEASHILTVDEMPAHNHTFAQRILAWDAYWPYSVTNASYDAGAIQWQGYGKDASMMNTGGGQAHNNMPPYLTVYIWKRTG